MADKGEAAAVRYLDKNRTKVTIQAPDAGLIVVGIIPADYGFSVKNDFEPLLTTSSTLGDVTKATQAFNQLFAETDLSVVPYSPMIWMGAKALQVNELTLHFVCYDSAYNDVHKPLMDLLAMSLPRAGVGGALAGCLNAPPQVAITIGNVISWKPCFIESVSVNEKAPYTKDGYGMTGEAKVTIIRRDYVFAEDFAKNSKSPTPISGNKYGMPVK